MRESNGPFLDRMLTHAQKRLTDATHELARVRQLQAPRLLAPLTAGTIRAAAGRVPAIAPVDGTTRAPAQD
jgi:hypothetical protein